MMSSYVLPGPRIQVVWCLGRWRRNDEAFLDVSARGRSSLLEDLVEGEGAFLIDPNSKGIVARICGRLSERQPWTSIRPSSLKYKILLQAGSCMRSRASGDIGNNLHNDSDKAHRCSSP